MLAAGLKPELPKSYRLAFRVEADRKLRCLGAEKLEPLERQFDPKAALRLVDLCGYRISPNQDFGNGQLRRRAVDEHPVLEDPAGGAGGPLLALLVDRRLGERLVVGLDGVGALLRKV